MRIGRIHKYTSECFDDVKSTGLEFIEICCNDAEAAANFVAAKESIKAEIERTGIDISSVGRWNHDVNEGGVINEEKFKGYIALMDAAIELGAKTFVCGINKSDDIDLEANYAIAVEFFSRLIDHADGRIKVAVQNCHWNNFIVSPQEWEKTLGVLPDLWLKYDPSHAYNRGDNYLAEMSDWGERIAHFHIKGTVHAGSRKVDDPPAGMDDIQWGPVFAILYARGYDGDLSIEPHSKTWRGELGRFGVEFTRDFMKKYVFKKQ